MPRGIWTLAISGMMALTQSGYAADPAIGQPAGKSSPGTTRISSTGANSQSVKKTKSAGQTSSKNYFNEFSNEDEPTATGTRGSNSNLIASWDDDDTPSVAPSASKSLNRQRSRIVETQESSFDGQPRKNEKGSATASDGTKFEDQIKQAIYDRVPEKKTPVQQVRNDGRPQSAPPVPGTEIPLDKSSRKVITRDHKARASVEKEISNHSQAATSAMVPTGPQTPQVTVELAKRGEFNVGQECLVDLIVRNTGESSVSNVEVDGIFPRTVRLIAADPQPAAATDRLTWRFDQMAPASELKMSVKLIPSQRGDIGAMAQVRFTGVSTATFTVSEPLLKIMVKSPKEVMLGDPASQMITLTNPGTGTAQDVKIEAKLSDGLEHPTRENRLIIEVGPIGPGETRTYRLPLTAAKGGHQAVSVVATSSSEATSTDTSQLQVVAPSMKVTVDGPGLRYKGRNAKYTINITNDGTIVNNNIHITQTTGDGFRFVSADHNGKFDSSVKNIHWIIGRLEPGESTQVNCELQSLQIGEFTHSVQVVSDTGVQADAKIDTRIDGIASLTMELADLDDPIETGSETGYDIRVKNDGSKAATNVIVTCDLPAGMEFLSTKAPVAHSLDGRQLTFNPIEQIVPGGQATIRIMMKVNRDGSHRMRVRLTGGGLSEPMVMEEATRAYSDGTK